MNNQNLNKFFRPLVSVIIPVYNGMDYVKEAIDSVLAQTYTNFEIVIVNDGSTDNLESIILGYGKRIRYYNKNNGGVATALNLAIEKSKGEYISWLSHDDLYYPDKLEKQIGSLSKLNAQLRFKTILYSNYSVINENSQEIARLNFENEHDINKLKYPLYPLLSGLINGCTLLIPKKCFTKMGYFDPKLKATQDYDLWYKMFPKYHIQFMSNYFVKTRVHSNQSTKTLPTVAKECDELWIKMVKRLSKKQKIAIGNSVIGFYLRTQKITRQAGYFGAYSYLTEIISKYSRKDISKIKVSVVVPFYQRVGETINAVKSILNQSHKNTEIIVIDDSSTEDVSRLITLCKKRQIKYYRNSKNSGAGYSRNFGIKKSTGEFIAFLDSDDIFLPEKIEKQLQLMISNCYVFSHTSYQVDYGDNIDKIVMNSGRNDLTFPEIISDCPIAASTVMVSKELLEADFFPEDIGLGEDVCAWIKLSTKTLLKGLDLTLSTVMKNGSNASDDEYKQLIGTKNIFDYVFNNYLTYTSVGEVKKLHNLVLMHINNVYATRVSQMPPKLGSNIKIFISNLLLRNASKS